MKLYCRSCKFYTTMEYDIYTHNFICQKCDKLLIGSYGYEILEFDDAGDLELYVTKDMFLISTPEWLFQAIDENI